MGNYVFNADALVDAVTSDADLEGTKHDMGGDIVPDFVNRGEAGVYDFKHNDVPGSTERDRDYWRDVGTIDSFFEAQHGPHLDPPGLQPLQLRVADLHDDRVPRRRPSSCTATVTGSARRSTRRSRPAASSPAPRSTGRCSRRAVKVHSYATIVDSVILDAVEIGRYATIRRAIIDKYTVIHEHAKIGIDHDHDRARGFHVTESGIVVVPRDSVVKA